jgi:nitrous oxidase accessory protein
VILLAAAGLLLAGAVPGWRLRALVVLPAILLPLLFVGDLSWWLRDYGLHLNPKAPLSSSVRPFIPVLLGQSTIAQFTVTAAFGLGFWCAAAAAVLGVLGLWGHAGAVRRAGRAAVIAAAALLAAGSPAVEAGTLVVEPGGRWTTLQEAVAAAQDGDTVVARGGVHAGPLVIDKCLRIEGEQGAVIDGGGRGTVIRITAAETVLRGLTIRRSGAVLSREDAGLLVAAPGAVIEGNRFEEVLFGVTVRHAPRTVIRGNAFHGQALPVARRGDLVRVWYSDDVVIEDNAIRDGRDLVLWFSQRILVRRNDIRRGRYGLHFMYCNEARVEDNRLSDNSVGVYLMYSTDLQLLRNRLVRNRGPSGYGLGLKDMEETTVEGNVLADNRVGVFMEHATGTFTHNLIALNDVGMYLFPTAVRNRLTANSFVDNGEQVISDGMLNAELNRWEGNYWSDYRGFDRDGDGAGDVPYRAMRLFERLAERYPLFRFYVGSPAAQAIDAAARVFPLFAPQPKLVDAAPRMRPVLPRTPPPRGGRNP